MTLAAADVEDLQAAIRDPGRVLPRGGGTKTALSTAPEGVRVLDVSALNGIVEYDPNELTLTALAGTPVAAISDALAEHGQYLPFDPPLPAPGATLAGAVATGASGPNALRHGGVRDFVIGVRLLDGTGRLVTGGGKVVKNAAGFDLPKLMVGSAGRLGVLVEISLKVFPRPQAHTTLRIEARSMDHAVGLMAELMRGRVELDALDFEPPGTLLARVGGAAATQSARVARLASGIGADHAVLEGAADAECWRAAGEVAWAPAGHAVIRVPTWPRVVPALDAALARHGARARYSLAGNVAWIAWPPNLPVSELDRDLKSLELAAIVLRGRCARPLLGKNPGGAFAARIRSALDPEHRFLEL